MHKGLFITFEGNDGSGKTTISTMICELLTKAGFTTIHTREPGGIDIAEKIRELILDPQNTAMDARTEALLYAASRRQHLIEKVLPAIDAGNIVICDRFIDSSLAYQGIGRGIGIDEVYHMNEFAMEDHLPDATIFLAVDLEVSLSRVTARGNKDRLENETNAFHLAVREGYKEVCERFSDRIHVIDANQDVETVLGNTYKVVMEIINTHV